MFVANGKKVLLSALLSTPKNIFGHFFVKSTNYMIKELAYFETKSMLVFH